MPREITVPELGESVTEATVGRWLRQPGDSVTAGDPLVELETEKVTMELVASESGTLESIAKPEGETARIGDLLGIIATEQ